jgi:hypothetical protein
MLRQIANVCFIALFIFLSFWVMWSSLDFQECIKGQNQNDRGSQHLEEGVSVFVVSPLALRRCAGAYVTDKKDVINAVATLVIALFTAVLGVFTVSLAGSTRKAASAAERAAITADKAIELSESASLVVDTWGVENWGQPNLSIKFHIYNSGKNTAEILGLVCRATVAAELPEAPDYTDAPRSPVALVAPGSRPESSIRPQILPEQVAAIETGNVALFVYGKITFKSVNFNTVWELGFAQRIVFPANSQGVRIAEFNYPVNPGFNFLRPKA